MSLGKVSQLSNNKHIAFKGYDKKLDKNGDEIHTFYYPHDSKEYRLQLELLKKHPNGDKSVSAHDIKDGAISLNLNDSKNSEFYYRFKLQKAGENPVYANDNGLLKDLGEVNGSTNPFNQIFPDRKIVSKPGRMQLQIPDMYYPGVVYDGKNYRINQALRAKALSSVRNHVGKLGGTLDGMIYMLPRKAEEGYTRIVGTPFTKDEVTSHLYWTQNAYQMASSLGGLQDMKRFQQALFKNGINFVADAALVNEGLQGIHFASLMKWGQDSPFFHWFKTYNLDSSTLSLGVIPKDSQYVRMKIINSPVETDANPVKFEKYNPNLPTIVQLYDARLTSDEQEKSDKVFTKYDKNPDNHYEITTYNDAIIPYSFTVDPKELAQNLKKENALHKGDFADTDIIKNVLSFSNFKIGERKDGGVELWDGNVDITKLNFSYGNYDFDMINNGSSFGTEKRAEEYRQGVREVQDYAVLSGKYWAKSAADIQLEYAAGAFKNVSNPKQAMSALKSQAGKILPKSVLKPEIANDEEIINNVFDETYNFFKLSNISTYTKISNDDVKEKCELESYDDFLKKSIMNLPLESLEVSDDVASILSSGYLTKRASTDEQIGLTRFDIYKSEYPNLTDKYSSQYKKMDRIMTGDLFNFADKVIKAYDEKTNGPKIRDINGDVTTFGKYAINAIAQDITKYALLKSLNPNTLVTVEKDYTLNFDKTDRSKLSVKALGIEDVTPELEANNLINKISSGMKTLNENKKAVNNVASALVNRLSGLNEYSFMMADMIVDRTESGMGLRVDAAKDIAAIDSVRSDKDNIAKIWDDVVSFWSKYVKEGIHSENPHAFSTAEITDVDKFINNNPVNDLKSAPEAERILLEKTGVTSIANYSYFFEMPIGLYSANPESGSYDGFKYINRVKENEDCLDKSDWFDNIGMLFQGPADSSIHSYTFSGNHDKPRILHVLGLDMNLYNSKLNDEDSQKIAKEVLLLDDDSDFNPEMISVDNNSAERKLSAPAVAMGKRLQDVFAAMTELTDDEKEKIRKEKEKAEDKKLEYIYANGSDNDKERILNKQELQKLKESVAALVKGIYNGTDGVKYFNADSFGQKPFDIVLDDVLNTTDLKESKKKEIKEIALKKMLAPAMEKYRSIYKMLTLLPGDPTDFAGDKEGMTGFESKFKNLTQQNRNAIRWEWLQERNPEYKPYIVEHKKAMDNIMALRTKSELSALNNGHTISLSNYSKTRELYEPRKRNYSANFRYNEAGSQVITIFAKPDFGDKPDPSKPLGSTEVEINELNLGKVRSREGLSAGLKEGTIFKNADANDKSIYEVVKKTITVPKEAPVNTSDADLDDKDYVTGKGYIFDQIESYVLVRKLEGKEIPITVGKKDDNALVLYKA